MQVLHASSGAERNLGGVRAGLGPDLLEHSGGKAAGRLLGDRLVIRERVENRPVPVEGGLNELDALSEDAIGLSTLLGADDLIGEQEHVRASEGRSPDSVRELPAERALRVMNRRLVDLVVVHPIDAHENAKLLVVSGDARRQDESVDPHRNLAGGRAVLGKVDLHEPSQLLLHLAILLRHELIECLSVLLLRSLAAENLKFVCDNGLPRLNDLLGCGKHNIEQILRQVLAAKAPQGDSGAHELMKVACGTAHHEGLHLGLGPLDWDKGCDSSRLRKAGNDQAALPDDKLALPDLLDDLRVGGFAVLVSEIDNVDLLENTSMGHHGLDLVAKKLDELRELFHVLTGSLGAFVVNTRYEDALVLHERLLHFLQDDVLRICAGVHVENVLHVGLVGLDDLVILVQSQAFLRDQSKIGGGEVILGTESGLALLVELGDLR